MEYIVGAGLLLLGYKLQNNKDQNNKSVSKKFTANVPKNQIPSVQNTYTSKRAYNIFQEEQKKADVLLEKSKYPQDTNVVTPGPSFPIMYNKVDYSDTTLPVEFNSYQQYDNVLINDNIAVDQRSAVNNNNILNNKMSPNNGGFAGISLTGNPINPDKFTHNNQVPFFGSAVKQNLDEFSTRGIFETFTGEQDNYQKKKEQNLFFEPQKNVTNVYGTQSTDGFMLDRYYVSNLRSNETPIEKVYVGPGLNQGYTNEPSGGFQQSDAQEYAMPKTTDEIRVKTNPKISYYGKVNAGQKIAKPGKVGTVYKNRPDTFYVQEADRYFTTTGQVIAPEQRPAIVTKYTNRKTTGLKTRTGSAAPTNGTVAQVRSKYRVSRKITYNDGGLRNAEAVGGWSITGMLGLGGGENIPNDYGKKSIRIRNNNRVTTKEADYVLNFKSANQKGVARNEQKAKKTKKYELIKNNRQSGNYQGSVRKGKVYDPSNIAKITVKQTTERNDHNGNLSAQRPSAGAVYDPNDVARTTIKETNVHNKQSGQMSSGVKKGVAYDPNDVMRTTIKETSIHNEYSGQLNSGVQRGVAYDPNDVTRTTIKETNIHNKHSGQMSSGVRRGVAYDPNDVTRTTIKETNIHNKHSGQMSSGVRRGVAYDPNDVARTTIKETSIHNEYSGQLNSGVRKGTVHDPDDVARTTIKETNIHNKHSGNMGKNAPSRGVVYDPSNTPKTTVKETTIMNKRKANLRNRPGTYTKSGDKAKTTLKQTTLLENSVGQAGMSRNDGYLSTDVNVPDTIRQHTSVQYFGDSVGEQLGAYEVTDVQIDDNIRKFTSDIEYFGGAGDNIPSQMSYEDIYNAEIKAIRGTTDQGYTPNPGGINELIDANSLNVTTKKIGDIQNDYINDRGVQATKVYNSLPQTSHLNITQDKNTVPNEPLSNRINPDLLNAFKENPYTQNLNSWA
jgi:hypothetical protein